MSCRRTNSSKSAFKRFSFSRLGLSDVEVLEPRCLLAAPEAYADAYLAQAGALLEVAAGGVLSNDVAADGVALTATLTRLPKHGTLAFTPQGGFRYLSATGFSGTDSFAYRAIAGGAESEIATVTIDVAGEVVAAKIWSVLEGGNGHAYAYLPQRLPWLQAKTSAESMYFQGQRGHLVAINSAAEQQWLDANLPAVRGWLGGFQDANAGDYFEPGGGWRWVTGEPFVYTNWNPQEPNNSGAEQYLESLNVGTGWNDAGLSGDSRGYFVEFPPAIAFAGDDMAGLPVGGYLMLSPTSNDLLPIDWDARSFETFPLHGSVAGWVPVTYQADAEYRGRDAFQYRVSRSDDEFVIATVWIKVDTDDHPLVARPDFYEVNEDEWLIVSGANSVLQNDEDADSASLRVTMVDPPLNGAIALFDGSFRYAPNPDFTGTDRFTYRAIGDLKSSEPTTVTIVVRPVNDAPRPERDVYRAPDAGPLVVSAAQGLLANDSEPERDSLSVELAVAPKWGQVELQPSGAFVYSPGPQFAGDSFRYFVRDTAGATAWATVVIAPRPWSGELLPLADFYRAEQLKRLVVDAPTGLLSNDLAPQDTAATVQLLVLPRYGNLRLTASGGFVYVPDGDHVGNDEFSYALVAGGSISQPTIVRIETTADASIALLPDFVDVNGDIHRYAYVTAEQPLLWWEAEQLAGTYEIAGRRGHLATFTSRDELLNPWPGSLPTGWVGGQKTVNWNWRWTTGEPWNALEVSDSDEDDVLSLDQKRLKGKPFSESLPGFFVEFSSASPVATLVADDLFVATPDAPLYVGPAQGVLQNDWMSVSANALLVSPPEHGTVRLTADGAFVYQPDEGYSGVDRFRYKIVQSNDTSVQLGDADAWVLVGSGDLNPPQAANDRYRSWEHTLAGGFGQQPGVLANDQASGQLRAILVQPPEHGTLQLNEDGSFVYVAANDYWGVDRFTYRAIASNGEGDNATAEITVSGKSSTLRLEFSVVNAVSFGSSPPKSLESVVQGNTYFLEAWLFDSSEPLQEIRSTTVDFLFPPDFVDRIGLVPARGGEIFDEIGLVSDVAWVANSSTPLNGWRRIATLRFVTDASGPVTFTSQPGRSQFATRAGDQVPWSTVDFGSLTVVSATPGDANLDGQINLTDFGLLKANFGLASGASFARGDFDGNGAIDLTDFGIIKANFGMAAQREANVPPVITTSSTSRLEAEEELLELVAAAAAHHMAVGRTAADDALETNLTGSWRRSMPVSKSAWESARAVS